MDPWRETEGRGTGKGKLPGHPSCAQSSFPLPESIQLNLISALAARIGQTHTLCCVLSRTRACMRTLSHPGHQSLNPGLISIRNDQDPLMVLLDPMRGIRSFCKMRGRISHLGLVVQHRRFMRKMNSPVVPSAIITNGLALISSTCLFIYSCPSTE